MEKDAELDTDRSQGREFARADCVCELRSEGGTVELDFCAVKWCSLEWYCVVEGLCRDRNELWTKDHIMAGMDVR